MLAVAWVGLSLSPASADDGTNAVQFADSLMLQHRYRESELEYERWAWLHPDHPEQTKVLGKMFNAALATGDYNFTLALARAWQHSNVTHPACLPFYYEQRALYGLGNYSGVLRRPVQPPNCDAAVGDETIYLRGLSRLHLTQWPEAQKEFEQITPSSTLYAQAHQAAQQSPMGISIPHKSPGLAAGLNAVLPGAGYLYAKRPQTAAACFVVNGLFIWGTVAAVHAKEPGLAALLALFSFTWYWGGIYGSAQSAQKENQTQLSNFIQPFELSH